MQSRKLSITAPARFPQAQPGQPPLPPGPWEPGGGQWTWDDPVGCYRHRESSGMYLGQERALLPQRQGGYESFSPSVSSGLGIRPWAKGGTVWFLRNV